MSTGEVGRRLKISPSTVRILAKEGHIKATPLPNGNEPTKSGRARRMYFAPAEFTRFRAIYESDEGKGMPGRATRQARARHRNKGGKRVAPKRRTKAEALAHKLGHAGRKQYNYRLRNDLMAECHELAEKAACNMTEFLEAAIEEFIGNLK
jgi:hypothetical protein